MMKNVGKTDKLIRLIIAAILLGLYFTDVLTGNIGIAATVIAFLLILTSVINFCPLYTLIGVNTCPNK